MAVPARGSRHAQRDHPRTVGAGGTGGGDPTRGVRGIGGHPYRHRLHPGLRNTLFAGHRDRSAAVVTGPAPLLQIAAGFALLAGVEHPHGLHRDERRGWLQRSGAATGTSHRAGLVHHRRLVPVGGPPGRTVPGHREVNVVAVAEGVVGRALQGVAALQFGPAAARIVGAPHLVAPADVHDPEAAGVGRRSPVRPRSGHPVDEALRLGPLRRVLPVDHPVDGTPLLVFGDAVLVAGTGDADDGLPVRVEQ